MQAVALPRVSAAAGVADSTVLFAAALGCLQPAIDPMFLTLLSEAAPVPLANHGLIVGATQTGAALGGLAVWRFAGRLPGRTFVLAAGVASLCALFTATVTSFIAASFMAALFPALLLLRGLYGVAMGMIFAHAMARSAARRPNSAYSGMFLLQLLLATLVSLVLPVLARLHGPAAALALLALAPILAGAALLVSGTEPGGQPATSHLPQSAAKASVPAAGLALAVATFCAVCATMLVWSFAGALATSSGLADSVIGTAVALGSLAGALTALAVMHERVLVPLPVTALLGGLMIASPLLLTGPGHARAFILSIILLNIGSTALLVRCSGLATATSRDSRFRTLVACTHSLGMIVGPLAGSALFYGFGKRGLLAFAILVIGGCFSASFYAAKQGVGTGTPWGKRTPVQQAAKS